MSIKFEFEEKNKIAVIEISKQLSVEQLMQAQSQCEQEILRHGNIKVLAILNNFEGWRNQGGWEELNFAEKYDAFIDKFAIVGDEKWKELIYAFTVKGLRPVPIEFFPKGDRQPVLDWLMGDD